MVQMWSGRAFYVEDPQVKMPARRTLSAAVVESSPSVKWKVSIAQKVIDSGRQSHSVSGTSVSFLLNMCCSIKDSYSVTGWWCWQQQRWCPHQTGSGPSLQVARLLPQICCLCRRTIATWWVIFCCVYIFYCYFSALYFYSSVFIVSTLLKTGCFLLVPVHRLSCIKGC